MEVQREEDYGTIEIGNPVTVDADTIEDGKYQLAETKKYYKVKKGRIFKILTETTYTNPDKHEIVIHQQDSWKIRNGDEAFMFGKHIDTTVINFQQAEILL